MPSQVITNARVWFDGYDMSCDLSAVALSYGVTLKEATTLCTPGIVRRPGLKTVTMQQEGFWAAANPDEHIHFRVGTAGIPVGVAPQNAGVDGEIAYMFRAIEGEYIQRGQVREMFRFSLVCQSSDGDPLVRGLVMHNATRTTSNSGVIRNLGAVATGQKIHAGLHIQAGAGGTLDVAVQSDALEAFGSATTVLSFTQASAAGSQWLTAAGPITDSWWRVGWTIAGGAPSFTFVVTLGIA